jgi:hypothetical protein
MQAWPRSSSSSIAVRSIGLSLARSRCTVHTGPPHKLRRRIAFGASSNPTDEQARCHRKRHYRAPIARVPRRANRGSVASAPTDVVRSGPKVQSGTAASSPPGQPDHRLLLRAAADCKEKSGLIRAEPARWLSFRETSSELVDARRSFVAHRPSRHALAAHLLRGRSCLCKPADDASERRARCCSSRPAQTSASVGARAVMG